MAAPASVTVNPGVKLLSGTATTGGITYTNGANGQTRTRVTSLSLCDKSKTGKYATVTLGGINVVYQMALPADGSPVLLTPNESLDGVETLVVIAEANTSIDVRATGEEIFVT